MPRGGPSARGGARTGAGAGAGSGRSGAPRRAAASEEDEGSGASSFIRLDGGKEVDSEEEEFDLAGSDLDDSDDSDAEDKGGGDSSGDDSEDDDDKDDDDDSEDDSEDDDDSDDDPNDLKALVDALPPKLRQKVLMKIKAKGKGGADDDDDDDDDDEDDEENEAALAKAALSAGKWGSSKSAYRGGDTADLEIGQDEQDAWDEEDAALEQQRQKLSSMRESDFLGGFSDDDEDEDDDEDAEQGAGGSDYFSSRAKAKGSAGGMLGTLEAVVLGAEKDSIHVHSLTQDPSKLTRAQRLSLIRTHNPELLPLVEELKQTVAELESVVTPARSALSAYLHELQDSSSAANGSKRARKGARGKAGRGAAGRGGRHGDEAAEDAEELHILRRYLEAREHALLCYASNIAYYLTHTASATRSNNNNSSGAGAGRSKVASLFGSATTATHRHPVMRQLLEIKYGLQKMKGLERALGAKARLWAGVETSVGNHVGGEDDEGEDDEGEDDEDQDGSDNGSDSDDFNEEEEDGEDEDEEDEDAIAAAIEMDEEEYSRPAASASGLGGADDPHRRLLAKAAKARAKAQGRVQGKEGSLSAGNYGEFGDVREERLALGRTKGSSGSAMGRLEGALLALQQRSKGKAKRGDEAGDADSDQEEDGGSRAGANGKKRVRKSDDVLDELYDPRKQQQQQQARVRRPAPSGAMDGDSDDEGRGGGGGDIFDSILRNAGKGKGKGKEKSIAKSSRARDGEDEDDLVERYSAAKKAFNTSKAEHYKPEPRFGGYEEPVGQDKKRAATYEMIKNKGLTPHRKKANRNPRVKKREAYHKAVVARKGQVRESVGGAAGDGYGGELTGIKSNLSRSRRLST